MRENRVPSEVAIRTAYISSDEIYRYELQRIWDESLPLLCVIMLNPSTANSSDDDHTIRKLVGFATRLGFGGFIVVNLFAFRATKPADLFRATEPVGKRNDAFIQGAVNRTAKTLCAWGSNAAGTEREREVRELLWACGIDTYALQINADGTPAHPLMLPYTCTLERFEA